MGHVLELEKDGNSFFIENVWKCLNTTHGKWERIAKTRVGSGKGWRGTNPQD